VGGGVLETRRRGRKEATTKEGFSERARGEEPLWGKDGGQKLHEGKESEGKRGKGVA